MARARGVKARTMPVDLDYAHPYTSTMIERTQEKVGAARASRPTAEFVSMMTDLEGVVEEADDEGYPRPSDLAISNAKRLLESLYRIAPRRFEVYPTPDAEIAIDSPGDGSSVIVLCDSSGGALCMANLPGGHRAKSYDAVAALPDGFLREVLA